MLALFTTNILIAEKLAVLPEVLRAKEFKVYGTDIYIKQLETIYLYSMESFKLIKKFGARGEGPGEFKKNPIFSVFPDYLLFEDITNKISLFSRDGILKYERRIPQDINNVYMVGENFVGIKYSLKKKTMKESRSIGFFTKEFKTIKELTNWEEKIVYFQKNKKKPDWPAIKNYPKHTVYNDRVYLADTRKGFFISVYDNKGNKLYDINKKYEKIKITKQFKEMYLSGMKRNRTLDKYNFIFDDYFPAFFIIVVKGGKIYAQTYKQIGGKTEIVILDLKGKFIKKYFVHHKGLSSFDNNKCYYLRENENEEYELHVEKL